MSDLNEPDVQYLIMEQEARFQRAELAKLEIQMRMRKRDVENKRDAAHLLLQDKVIAEAKEVVQKLRDTHGVTEE